jgi:hypothetical protein
VSDFSALIKEARWTRRAFVGGLAASAAASQFSLSSEAGFLGAIRGAQGPMAQNVLNLNASSATIRQSNVIQQTLGAGSTNTLYSASPGFPGYLNSILIVQKGASCNDDLLQVFVDGEITPSLQFDTGSILGHNVPLNTNVRAGTEHAWAGYTNYNGAGVLTKFFTFTFPIPYKTSIIVKYVVNVTVATELFSDVEDIQGITIPYKLLSVNQTRLSPATITQSQLNTNQATGGVPPFLNVSGQGWVVFFSLATQGASNMSYMENRPSFFLNGNTYNGSNVPDWTCDGLEGVSWDAWNYTEGAPYSRRESAVILLTASQISITLAVDFLALNRGIPFNTGCYMTWQPKPPAASQATTGVTAAWLVLYYIPN